MNMFLASGFWYLTVSAICMIIGFIIWWDYGRRQTASLQPIVKPDGKLSREEFASRLASLVGAESIIESASPEIVDMQKLTISAAFHFGMMFSSSMQPTVGKIIDDLYKQYLHQ